MTVRTNKTKDKSSQTNTKSFKSSPSALTNFIKKKEKKNKKKTATLGLATKTPIDFLNSKPSIEKVGKLSCRSKMINDVIKKDQQSKDEAFFFLVWREFHLL